MTQNLEGRVVIPQTSIGFGSNSLFLTHISPDLPGFSSGFVLCPGKCCFAWGPRNINNVINFMKPQGSEELCQNTSEAVGKARLSIFISLKPIILNLCLLVLKVTNAFHCIINAGLQQESLGKFYFFLLCKRHWNYSWWSFSHSDLPRLVRNLSCEPVGSLGAAVIDDSDSLLYSAPSKQSLGWTCCCKHRPLVMYYLPAKGCHEGALKK